MLLGWVVGLAVMGLLGGDRPNVVVILADDLGWGDVRANQPEGKIATPRLDQLASEGVRFTDAHSDAAVCTPTRYGLMTGRHSWRSRLKRGVLGGLSPCLLEPDRPTVASFLHSHGYRTACIGKWHLGLDWVVLPGKTVMPLGVELDWQTQNVDYAQPISRGPTHVGFDSFFGIAASLDMVPYTYILNDRVVNLPTERMSFPMVHGRPDIRSSRPGPGAPGFRDDQVLPDFLSRAVASIESFAQEDRAQPFFLYLPLAAPHTPVAPTEPWRGKSGLNAYADFVMQTDAAIGTVMDTLDRTGLREKTILIVSSDNGFAPMADAEQLERLGHRPSGPFRGYKADLYEGGHRVPLIVSWPGRYEAGRVVSAVVCLNDLFATLADVMDEPLPPGSAEDSVSFKTLLEGQTAEVRQDLISLSQNGSLAIREQHWKLLTCPDSGGWSFPRPGVDNTSKLPRMQLFDLRNDPGEQKNLAESRPEIVERLRDRLERYQSGEPVRRMSAR
jgi:arylsulfatase A-like enzyme